MDNINKNLNFLVDNGLLDDVDKDRFLIELESVKETQEVEKKLLEEKIKLDNVNVITFDNLFGSLTNSQKEILRRLDKMNFI